MLSVDAYPLGSVNCVSSRRPIHWRPLIQSRNCAFPSFLKFVSPTTLYSHLPSLLYLTLSILFSPHCILSSLPHSAILVPWPTHPLLLLLSQHSPTLRRTPWPPLSPLHHTSHQPFIVLLRCFPTPSTTLLHHPPRQPSALTTGAGSSLEHTMRTPRLPCAEQQLSN